MRSIFIAAVLYAVFLTFCYWMIVQSKDFYERNNGSDKPTNEQDDTSAEESD